MSGAVPYTCVTEVRDAVGRGAGPPFGLVHCSRRCQGSAWLRHKDSLEREPAAPLLARTVAP